MIEILPQNNADAIKENPEKATGSGLVSWIKKLAGLKPESEEDLREAIEEYIEEMSASTDALNSTRTHELKLLSNILELRDLTAEDVMVQRADIIAIDIDTHPDDLLRLIVENNHHRIPVYRGTLDEIIGTIQIKDILEVLARKEQLVLKNIVKESPVVSPAMPVFDLLLLMRESHQQLVFVVDEYGGIDGLITIGDVVGSIIGEVQNEFMSGDIPELSENKDGSFIADARMAIENLEEAFGQILDDEERDIADTLGGFISSITGRVPARGEVIKHENSGFIFEVLEADARRILRLKIIPKNLAAEKAPEA